MKSKLETASIPTRVLDAYERLASAIVLTGFDDYVNAYIKYEKAKIAEREAQGTIKEVKKFFSSPFCDSLTSLSGEDLILLAEKKAEYRLWREKNGCDKCPKKPSDCMYKAKKDNWRNWVEGESSCLRRNEINKKSLAKKKTQNANM